MRNSSLLAIISLAFLIGTPLPAIAEEKSESTNKTPPSSATLKGHVVNINETLNQLRDARLSISRVRKATANLYDEVTRQQVTMSFNPNLVGTTVMMTPSPTFDAAFRRQNYSLSNRLQTRQIRTGSDYRRTY
ncbi:MAG: hypothetical protein IT342_17620 [Candidatus Melainabacteria bacterium]|nr:hypothetical protein [Candidatus Melainabacteria bacterium]